MTKILRGFLSTAQFLSIENRILRQIAFEFMYDREDSISDANAGTYEWLLNNAHETPDGFLQTIAPPPNKDAQKQCRDLAKSAILGWLASGSRIFHISGHPGSGKSTLMKFLCNHPRTREELQKWAMEKELIIGKFFFWNSGSRIEMSLEGLFRAILFETLRGCPNLIPTVFPEQWALFQHPENSTRDTILDKSLFRSAHIHRGFQNLVYAQDPRHRLCLFIDGLDEYHGSSWDHYDLALRIRDWTRSGNVKICVSSRPYNEYLHAFPASPDRRIHLHEITKPDIYLYVREALNKFPEFDRIESISKNLTKDIVEKSEGVFMWAILVVRIL
ncbi:hypothetical protein GQ53DRAFT_632752, partial [Thozetella sp. PMI_491]